MLENIVIKGAKENNLKNVSLTIPKNKLVVFCGVSGCGKSTLAFDTIFAEGQRRYMESLSSYARQFLGQMHKPDVESIDGLSPAISIDQKSTNNNPRSTVGTITEIYDYLRLLYARIGKPYCPKCGKPISVQTLDQIVDKVLEAEDNSKMLIMAPIVRAQKGTQEKVLDGLRKDGFARVMVDNEIAVDIQMVAVQRESVEVAVWQKFHLETSAQYVLLLPALLRNMTIPPERNDREIARNENPVVPAGVSRLAAAELLMAGRAEAKASRQEHDVIRQRLRLGDVVKIDSSIVPVGVAKPREEFKTFLSPGSQVHLRDELVKRCASVQFQLPDCRCYRIGCPLCLHGMIGQRLAPVACHAYTASL